MGLLGRWWNGKYGMARRDIWLTRETVWRVRARAGDDRSSREFDNTFIDENQARDLVDELMGGQPDQWRDLTALVQQPPQRAS